MEKSMNPRVHYQQTREAASPQLQGSSGLRGVPLGSPLWSEMSCLPKAGQAQPQDAGRLAAAVRFLGETQLCAQVLSLPRTEVVLPSQQVVSGFTQDSSIKFSHQTAQIIFIAPLNSSLGFGVQVGVGDAKEKKSGFKSFLPGSVAGLVGYCLGAGLAERLNRGDGWVPVALLAHKLSNSLCSEPGSSGLEEYMMINRCLSPQTLAPGAQGGVGSSDACLC